MTATIRKLGPPSGGFVWLRGMLRRPSLWPLAAGLLLASVAGLLAFLLLGTPKPAAATLSLQAALTSAPAGWREALHPRRGGLAATELVIQLTEDGHGRTGDRRSAVAAAPAPPPVGPLPAAPILGFSAPGPAGPLPIIAAGGRTPFEAYKRPFTPDGRPRIALVIGGLGLDARTTRAAIETLPAEVTLSFAPYADDLQGWIDQARAHGHEVLLEAPMEPADYPDNDPGPYTLLADAPGPETVKKLEWLLSRAQGYFALSNSLGGRFLARGAAYDAFAGALRARGLGFLDDGRGAGRGGGLPRASAERVVDRELTRAGLDRELAALEASAGQHGQAFGVGAAYPVTLEKTARWAVGLKARGFQLAPASALVRRPTP